MSELHVLYMFDRVCAIVIYSASWYGSFRSSQMGTDVACRCRWNSSGELSASFPVASHYTRRSPCTSPPLLKNGEREEASPCAGSAGAPVVIALGKSFSMVLKALLQSLSCKQYVLEACQPSFCE